MAFLLNLVICSLAMAQSSLPKCPEDKSNGWSECFGAIKLSDGDTYSGEWRGGKPNGQGTATLGKDRYVGAWKDGQYSGYGTYFFADGRPPKEGVWANGEFIRAEKAPAQQSISLTKASKDSQKNGSTAFCFAPVKSSVSSCNALVIQGGLKDGETVDVYEFVGADKLKMTVIYPNSNIYIAKKINETIMEFKRNGNSFEKVTVSGCVTKGLITETRDKITLTEKSQDGNCAAKGMWEKYLKDKKQEMKKIQY
jgi:hypothetical protein